MAEIVTELFGRRLSGNNGELVFLITGTEDPDAARDAMLADTDALASLGDLDRDDAGSEVEEYDGVSGGAYLGRVRYKKAGRKNPPSFNTNDSVYSFSISGAPTRIYQSKSTTSYGTDPPDFKGAINVQDGQVDGVDIVTPESNFSETHFIPIASMDAAYQRTIESLVGKVNNATFKGRAAGEVLFLGANGTRRGDDDWEVEFRFARSLNATNIPIGPITVTSKAGWNYLWVLYEAEAETERGTPIKTPVAAYVERVYDEADFSALGIGT